MESLVSVAGEFVAAYYTALVYNPSDVRKFYDEDRATVWRHGLDSEVGVRFRDAESLVVPVIAAGSLVSIVSYAVLPIASGFSLVARGQIAYGGDTQAFEQFFTVTTFADRWFIESDALSIGTATARDADLVDFPHHGPPPQQPGAVTESEFCPSH